MKPNLRILAAATLAACILPVMAFAQNESGGAPGSWLSGYAGARTVGLGGAFVATADDALGVLWNPAGLQWMDQNMAMFEKAMRMFNPFGVGQPGGPAGPVQANGGADPTKPQAAPGPDKDAAIGEHEIKITGKPDGGSSPTTGTFKIKVEGSK